MTSIRQAFFFLILAPVISSPVRAEDTQNVVPLPPVVQKSVDFTRDIKPILESRCTVCHGKVQQLSGLRLDQRSTAMQGGYSGPVIVPHKSSESKLIRIVAGAIKDVVMPPSGDRLSNDEIGLLRAWIDQGAPWPSETEATFEEAASSSGKKSSHWAYQPLKKPAPPEIDNPKWARNPVDHFILARLNKEGVDPSPEADKHTLFRRLHLDLTGLPPTPAQVTTYTADTEPDAYEAWVDRLLESPYYGEKWAMQWLDLARYADSDGYEKDQVRPHAWRYRHWVIKALNDDMPFDQFTMEQIAGDLLPNADTEQQVATGFHRNTLKNREGGVKIEQFRFEEVIDRANTVGTVWMGLTVGCAQCHDHKYDPITQKDYYSLFSFFNSADEVNIDAPLAGEMGPFLKQWPRYRAEREELLSKNRVYELMPPWEEKMRLAARNPGKWTDLDHAYDALGKYLDNGHGIVEKSPSERTRKETDGIVDHFVKNYHRVITKEFNEELNYKDIFGKLQQLTNDFPAISEAQTIAESPHGRESNIHIRGAWNQKGVKVSSAIPAFLGSLANAADASRIDLAAWIISESNPLTSRVTVNRIWQEYFGAGLVRTSENFGSQGETPSHPNLLDWLAADFIEHGWSLKKVHKTIVMSAAYRQSSAARPELVAQDPDNRWLARQQRLRLPAELVRDSTLAVSGLLYPKIGGKSIRPPLPAGVTGLSYANQAKWPESTGQDRYRRGLYILLQRTILYPQMATFDATAREMTLCKRERSNTPLQSLNLLNDPVFTEAAQALAVRILSEPKQSFNDRLQHAFQLALARPPNNTELESLRSYYQRQTQIFEQEPGAAEKLAPVELAGVSRIETAAWTGLSSVLLNLDEFITRE
jgi:hypothetical protein